MRARPNSSPSPAAARPGGLDGSAGAAWDTDTRAIDVPAGVGATTVQLVSEPVNQNPDAFLWTLSALRVLVPSAPPVAVDDSYSTAEDAPLTVPVATGVLANDSDPNGDALTAAAVDDPANVDLTVRVDDGTRIAPPGGSCCYLAQEGDPHGYCGAVP